MKFGEHLRKALIKNYSFYYISYDDLKHQLKKGLKDNDYQWNNELEEDFLNQLETELDKVYSFTKVKNTEVNRRIKESEKYVHEVVNTLHRYQNNDPLVTSPPQEQDFEDLEEELSDIIADVHDLAKFARLNYTGFQKIIKKHDKTTGYHLKPVFQARLNSQAFYKDNYDNLIVKLSKLYDLVRTRGNPIKGDSSAGGSQQNFVRQTTKYWVHPDNITELKLIILKHLPVLVFNADKEFEPEDSAITSIYFDNEDMDLYYGRLRKDEGAEAIRLRWYGGMKSDQIFVERKTHREDWTGEKSVKARFALKEKKVNDYLSGKLKASEVFDKMRKEGKKSPQEIENLERLAQEVQYRVLKDKMRPVMRSFYNRTAFQLPGDARVRISLDTELTMVREDDFDGYDRTHGNWRRMDIGVDYPFPQLPEKDVCRFQYAVLEVKLQTQMGQEPPVWVRDLVNSHLVEAVPKFSKFIHGGATLLTEMVDLLPFWYTQMDVDIRKPKVVQEYGIQRHQNPSHQQRLGSSTSGNDLDEEELTGSSYTGVHFSNDINPLEEDLDEQTPLLLPSNYTSRHTNSPVKNFLYHAYGRFLHYFNDDRTFTVKPGTNFDLNATFKDKLPQGKIICVPVRIEPKVYFANERTFLSWISIGMLMGFTATALLNYGTNSALTASIGFFITALFTLGYAIYRKFKIDEIDKKFSYLITKDQKHTQDSNIIYLPKYQGILEASVQDSIKTMKSYKQLSAPTTNLPQRSHSPIPLTTNILIIGGAYAGIAALRALQLKLSPRIPKGGNPISITIVEPKDGFLNILGISRSIVSPSFAETQYLRFTQLNNIGFTNIISDDDIEGPICENSSQVIFVHGKVVSLSSQSAEYVLNNNTNKNRIDFDYVIMASGRDRNWPTTPLANTQQQFLDEISRAKDQIESANIISIIGAGAVGVEIAGDIKTAYPNKIVNLIHPHEHFPPEPLSLEFKTMVQNSIERSGVNIYLNTRIDKELDNKNLVTTTQKIIESELNFHCCSKHNNTSFLSSQLQQDYIVNGQVNTNKYLQLQHPTTQATQDHFFVIGDLVNFPIIKSAGWAMYMGRQVANNITSLLFDGELVESMPDLSTMPYGMVIVGGNEEIISELSGDVQLNHEGYKKEYLDYCIGKVRATLDV
ncbi:VTC4 [Candida margitis]|uniref:VTC4 n=1 Tax=Candida margitis TaxID=1775924 RepID=UPI002227A08C|nr:VTC4 [Candida margitis]KAI5970549.1 VTC4 [Candida margitis]